MECANVNCSRTAKKGLALCSTCLADIKLGAILRGPKDNTLTTGDSRTSTDSRMLSTPRTYVGSRTTA
jgi:hypothetical protein